MIWLALGAGALGILLLAGLLKSAAEAERGWTELESRRIQGVRHSEAMRDNAHFGDPCYFCGSGHNKVKPGPCPGPIRKPAAKMREVRHGRA